MEKGALTFVRALPSERSSSLWWPVVAGLEEVMVHENAVRKNCRVAGFFLRITAAHPLNRRLSDLELKL